MKPLLLTVAVLLLMQNASLEKTKDEIIDPKIEPEGDESQTREARCSSCSASASLGIKSRNNVLSAVQSLPGTEVHSQSSLESCSSDNGCAGIKVKDGQVIEKYGNVDAFKAAAAANTANEFSFHTAENLANIFKGGVQNNVPFWWMNDNSPFKNAAAGGSFQQFSKSSSSSFSTGGSGSAGGSGSLDLTGNPFLNGDFSKGTTGKGFAAGFSPETSKFQSSSFKSSSSFSSSNNGQIDLSNNPFLSGKLGAGFQSGSSKFGAQGFGSVGSTPGPFTASTAGSNVNLIQSNQKNQFEYTQQTQGAGNAFGSGSIQGGFQGFGSDQACTAQNYDCVSKSQCINGVININGVGIIQSRAKKTQCNSQTEVCCRIDTSVSAFGQSSSSGSAFSSSSSGLASQGAFGNSGSNAFGSNSGSKFSQDSFGASQSGSLSGSSSNGISGSNAFGANSQSGSSSFGIASKVNSAFESNSASLKNQGSLISGNRFASTVAPSFDSSNSRFGIKTSSGSSQGNFISSDSSSAGSATASIFRPGAPGSINKPGIPYLPPVDLSTAQNFISSTAIPPTPPYIPPRPSTTPRPIYTTPVYLPPVPSTSAPGYLPPISQPTIQTEIRVPPNPADRNGSLYLEQTSNRPKQPFVPSEIGAGCAAALKCTPIEYCTAEGVISSSPVILSKDRESYRVPLTDCKDTENGVIGKCCRDPNYSDPWPADLIGKWAPGVFGGNDGKYTPDNAGSPNIPRLQITARPPVSSATLVPNYRKEITPPGPTQGTRDYRPTPISTNQKNQYIIQGGGQTVSQGSGIGFRQNQGIAISQQGGGQIVDQGSGFGIRQNQGIASSQQGGGQIVDQGSGFGIRQNQGIAISQQGGGQIVDQGSGFGIRQNQGIAISQQGGYSIEEQYILESRLFRVLLQRYGGSGECGLSNGQKPYGDKNELEVDFAEIPWQAMVLLQTNRSLLCGGVITRPDVVVTSASCVEGLLARNVLIKGGEWKLAIEDEPLPYQIVQVKYILRHPEYRSGSFENDVAILVLTENLKLAKNIWPICLPGLRDTLDAFYNGNGECIVTGWGKQVLQAHLSGRIMHKVAVNLLRPEQCQSKLSQEYPHLLSQYSNTYVCGQPSDSVNNICKVDTGSALACTTGDGHYVLRGVYDWDSGCQPGNQIAAFYRFDLEWYEWAIGLGESSRFTQFAQESQKIVSQIDKGFTKTTTGLDSGSFTTGSGFTSSSGATGTIGSGIISGAGAKGFTTGDQFQHGTKNSQILTSSNVQGISTGLGAIGSGIGGTGKGFTATSQFQQNSPSFTFSGGQRGIGGSAATGGIGSNIVSGAGLTTSGQGGISGFVPTGTIGLGKVDGTGANGFTGSKQFQQSYSFTSSGNLGGIGGSGATGTIDSGTKGFTSTNQFQKDFKGSQTFSSSGSQGQLISSEAASGSGATSTGNQGLKGFTVSGEFQQGSQILGATSNRGGAAASGITGAGTIDSGKFGQRTSESFGSSGSLSGGTGSGFGLSGAGVSGGGFQKGSGFSQFSTSGFNQISAPIQNTFSATYSEKKIFKSKPKYEFFTTKPEIVTFTTKPEIFTYTTKPKVITYTTKPQIITYETSGSGQNTQYVAAGSSINPTFDSLVGHTHNSQCKCLENGKK